MDDDYPQVFIHDEIMSQAEIYGLHMYGDCLVLPSCGEGWGRPIAEACVAGNAVIATGYGGIHDWLNGNYIYETPYEMVPVKDVPWVKYYEPGQEWAGINVDDLSHNMSHVYTFRDVLYGRTGNARDFVTSNFSFDVVGRMMGERLREIEKGL